MSWAYKIVIFICVNKVTYSQISGWPYSRLSKWPIKFLIKTINPLKNTAMERHPLGKRQITRSSQTCGLSPSHEKNTKKYFILQWNLFCKTILRVTGKVVLTLRRSHCTGLVQFKITFRDLKSVLLCKNHYFLSIKFHMYNLYQYYNILQSKCFKIQPVNNDS